ncbi:MAG: cyclic nucleotide-binding domain-containing protein [Gammaproteobacteria bacterium]
MDEKRTITLDRLKQLEPLSNLSTERLEELVTLSSVERLPIGHSVFREGDIDNQTVYLLDGDIQLSTSDGKLDKVMTSKQKEALYPLDDSQPRQMSCVALSRIDVLRIDNSVLDYMMMWDQMAVSEAARPTLPEQAPEQAAKKRETVAEDKDATPVASDEDRSWIRKMRHIMAFKNMPPANIKSLLERMETLLVQDGDVIVKQGEAGDYYYVLTEGTARVTRTVELAQLQPGTSFGEEALVSGSVRNATVTMTSDGMLMRLSKDNFNELLKEPLLERLSPDDARDRAKQGAIWLDVRHAKEFHHGHLPNALNIPLHELRIRIHELDKQKNYICYCGTGRRSGAAAFLLVQNGLSASVLSGGVQVMAQDLQPGS